MPSGFHSIRTVYVCCENPKTLITYRCFEILILSNQRVIGTMKAREPVIAALRSVVEQDHRLVFAYIYGSFIRGEAFRDVDVGIYLRDTSEDPFAVSFLETHAFTDTGSSRTRNCSPWYERTSAISMRSFRRSRPMLRPGPDRRTRRTGSEILSGEFSLAAGPRRGSREQGAWSKEQETRRREGYALRGKR